MLKTYAPVSDGNTIYEQVKSPSVNFERITVQTIFNLPVLLFAQFGVGAQWDSLSGLQLQVTNMNPRFPFLENMAKKIMNSAMALNPHLCEKRCCATLLE